MLSALELWMLANAQCWVGRGLKLKTNELLLKPLFIAEQSVPQDAFAQYSLFSRQME